MKVADLGEFALIARIAEQTLYSPETVLCGIGDDAAVLKPDPGMVTLATTDMLVENVHFKLDSITPWQLGYKSLAVNISDIAAMGGFPGHALLSLGLPAGVSVSFVEQFYAGVKYLAAEHGINIVGGDTVFSPAGMVINVVLLGSVEPDLVVYRSGAQPGDLIVVSGTLGDSAAGLQLLLEGKRAEKDRGLIEAHVMPRPQVELGRICAQCRVRAMNDISDGLASEINEICKASGTGALIRENALPLSAALLSFVRKTGQAEMELALYGGEDYQLVFTADKEQVAEIGDRLNNTSLTVVGEITAVGDGVLLEDRQGRILPLLAKGYDHFRKG